MKKNILLVLLIIASFSAIYAQFPNGINYQAIIRDGGGNVIANTEIALQISILAQAPDGEIVYSEIYNIATNSVGLVNIIIGNGTAQTGEFSEINWGESEYYFEVATDIEGGDNFVSNGVSQFLSVPYAHRANNANNADCANALTLVDEHGNEYEITVDTLGNIVANALNPYRIMITFSSPPSDIEISSCMVRYGKQHVLTYEQDDNMRDIYHSILPLFSGGVPYLEPGYTSPGRFLNDGFGGQITMKGQVASWVYTQVGGPNWWYGMGGKLNMSEYEALFDKGFGVSSHEYYGNLTGMTDEVLYEVSQLYQAFVEAEFGIEHIPLTNVMGGGHVFNLTAWNLGWFDSGALYSVNGSGSSPSRYDLEVDHSLFTTTHVVGRYRLDDATLDAMKTKVDALMAESGHKAERFYSHGFYHLDYFNFKAFVDYLEATYADELWMPSMNELTKYLHVRDKVIYNQQLTGNVLTITLDESAIPNYIIPRALTIKVTADVDIQNISVKGFDNKTKGEGSNEAYIDLEW